MSNIIKTAGGKIIKTPAGKLLTKPEVPETNYLCFTAEKDKSGFSFMLTGEMSTKINLQYSTNGIDWQEYPWPKSNEVNASWPISLNKGDKVYLKGNNTGFGVDDENHYQFYMGGKIAASGSIMSLLDGTGTTTVIPSEWCFSGLFDECGALTSAPELPATTLTFACYYAMFNCCESLKTPPVLPATELAVGCYAAMFSECYSLTTAPELPALSVPASAYSQMFAATAITEAPALPATTVDEYAYFVMFTLCRKLKTVPALPATTIGESSYDSMFNYCDSLNVFPESGPGHETKWNIAATSGPVQGDMVGGCGGTFGDDGHFEPGVTEIYLGESGPDYLCFTALEANSTVNMTLTGTPTQSQAFEYSTDKSTWNAVVPNNSYTLEKVGDKMYFRGDNTTVSESAEIYYQFAMTGKISGSGDVMTLLSKTRQTTTCDTEHCFTYLFKNCAALVTAPYISASRYVGWTCFHMFENCTSLTKFERLPASSLGESAYYMMFRGCSALTTAPALPATGLYKSCYRSMFYDCTALTTPPALPATDNFLAERCYQQMFHGCSSLQVYSASGAGHDKAWRIPTSGTASEYTDQIAMFEGCPGDYYEAQTVSLNNTFYTQNTPVFQENKPTNLNKRNILFKRDKHYI